MSTAAMDGRLRRPQFLVLLAGSAALLAGCLVIPVDYYQVGSRHNLSTESPAKLQDGAAREDVLLTLGEPDFVSEDGRRLGYAWTKVKAVVFVAGPGGGATGEIQRSYVLEVSFGANNRVSGVRLLKEWGPLVTPTRELEPER